MEQQKVKFTWKEYDEAIDKMVSEFRRHDFSCNCIYGLPRGGLTIAVSLSHRLGLPLVTEVRKTDYPLIVDDISDSGETLKNFTRLMGKNRQGYRVFTIHYADGTCFDPEYYVHNNNGKWIVYPWEVE